jgi:hypothetical protein
LHLHRFNILLLAVAVVVVNQVDMGTLVVVVLVGC